MKIAQGMAKDWWHLLHRDEASDHADGLADKLIGRGTAASGKRRGELAV